MKTILSILTLALGIINLTGQTLPKNDPLKLDADYYLMDKEFKKALNNYLTIIKSEPDNADIKYKIGICYMNSENDKNQAISYLEEASQKISEKHNSNSFKETSAPVDALFVLGSAYRINNQLDQAIAAYNRYKEYLDPKDEYNQKVVDQFLKSCEVAKNMQSKPVNVTSVNLGSPLNTDAANFRPVISGDGKTMFYTTTARQGYDIFLSNFKDTAWTTPRNVTSVLGTGKYMMTSDLSFDGQTLLLTMEDPLNSDIYISHFNKGRWSKAEPLGKEINSKYNETHASFSTDNKTIYFTSDRKGGLGDKDIYKSEINLKGEWNKAENLGTLINTAFNEETPFMSEIGDRLYFSSEGHNSIGGYDIYYYDFSNPSKGVVNLGYPLNTTDNDLFYVPSGDGMTAYYAFAGEDSYGGRDIYRVIVEERVEESLSVSVSNEEEGLGTRDEGQGEVGLSESESVSLSNEEEGQGTSDEGQGEVGLGVSLGESVSVSLSNEGEGQGTRDEGQGEVSLGESVGDDSQMAVVETTEPVNPVNMNIPAEEPVRTAVVHSGAVSYRIQIMALRKPADLKSFLNLPGIMVSYSSDNWYRYCLGSTSSRDEAQNLLSEMISKGYKDAFIKALSVEPHYTIQVMAVPGPVVDLSHFTNLSDIYVVRGSDNFCRYSTGEFSTREEALASLDAVKSKGYKTAFVAKIR